MKHVVHIRRLNIPLMLCGAREFEPGEPRRLGIYNVSRATCEECLKVHRARVAKLHQPLVTVVQERR